MKRTSLLIILPLFALTAKAQGPNDTGTYYQAADGLKGEALKTALFNIIADHTDVGYDELWQVFELSDKRDDGYYWDIYSATSQLTYANLGNYSKEGDAVNREHTVPQSWFSSASPMRSDAFHIFPTDGYVNGRRGNNPYGEVSNPTYSSNEGFSKVGPCTTEGYTGTVFEPNDLYKGDLARVYFYMATAYEDQAGTWSGVFGEGTYPTIVEWQLNMLLRWAVADTVSQKELDRNEAVCSFQNNRNPFIDYPGLEQYIWGSAKDSTFSYDHYVQVAADYSDTTTTDTTATDTVLVDPVTPSGEMSVFRKITSSSQLSVGSAYLIVSEYAGTAMGEQSGNYFTGVEVTIDGDSILTAVNGSGEPLLVTLGGGSGAYTLVLGDASYLTIPSDKNYLTTTTELSDNSLWTISVSNDAATITNNSYTERSIQWNPSSPRFSSYASSQKPVQLYQMGETTVGVSSVSTGSPAPTIIYDLQGRRINRISRPGIYIVGGRKVVVKD